MNCEKEEEESNSKGNVELDVQKIVHQNDLLLFWLEQSAENEETLKRDIKQLQKANKNNEDAEVLQKKIKIKEEEWLCKEEEYEQKLEAVEKSLMVETN